MEVKKPMNPILIADDEEGILLSIDTILRMAGYNNIVTEKDSRKVKALFDEMEFDTVLLDLTMPYVDGEEILSHIEAKHPDIPVIIVTGAVDVETAVRCMKKGAFDYVVKPVEDDKLVAAMKRALSFRELTLENRALKESLLSDNLENPDVFKNIVTRNPKMLSIFKYIESIATTSQPVLIRGETGVGKELVARCVHRLSGLSGRFVALNVAGLDDSMFSDTLFGHVKGAFTGADNSRKGLIEKASGGTLFLDEIGDLSPVSQVKLLRLLQEGEYFSIGEDDPRYSDARILASTHQDIFRLQKSGKFREDLTYRLKIHDIHLPSLRERKDDLPLLVDHFLKMAAQELEKDAPTPPKELMNLLNTYDFPGNIRELKAMVFDAVSRHKSGVLSLSTFKDHIFGAKTENKPQVSDDQLITFSDKLPTLRHANALLIEEAMKRANGVQSVAAGLLGITQQALSKRLKNLSE